MLYRELLDGKFNVINTLLIAAIAYFLLFRGLHLTPDLINKHSWGESQYAMWASSYVKEGLFYGMREYDCFKPFTNYVPIASMLAAEVSDKFNTNLIFTGRVVSFLFSILSVIYFRKTAKIIFNDDFKALVSTVVFVVLPINMYYSQILYNDPIHLFFIIYLTYIIFSNRDHHVVKFYYSSIFVFTVAILLTKPTAAIIYGLPMLFLYYDDWRNTRFDKKEFICMTSAFVIALCFILFNRIIYADGFAVEHDKLITQIDFSEYGKYFTKAWNMLTLHFQNYYYVYIAALPIAAFSSIKVRFFFFMSLGFFLFFILFVKGAIVHQYYALPFVLPFSVIVAYGLFQYTGFFLKHRNLFAVVVVVLLIIFAPEKRTLNYMFKPEYSRDLMHVVNVVKNTKGDKNIFISAFGHKIFQYYLDIPTDQAQHRWELSNGNINYLNVDYSISDYFYFNEINILILSNHKDSSAFVRGITNTEFYLYYCSNDYLVYVRGIADQELMDCVIKI